ncbi:putative lipase [Rhodococcoides trifolii]|uniref:Lipase n=1 Tax=Rhodococcoides trifolii TaxID=908250 RepID=A0A917G461_9NOCA|nr:lipase family protein [Rhodococcus trifolii]GGG22047.1 putative lipase [Rhodococcus trifolii]
MHLRRTAAGVVALVLLAGCSTSTTTPSTAPPSTTTPTQPTVPAPAGDERGQIVSSDLLGQVDQSISALGASEYRVTYRSTSGLDGGGVIVSGTVFVPAGTAPTGGWPVVSVGHGTTGVTDECAPSLYPNLLGNITTVAPALARGAVVVVTDFQGLGTDGPHPYLDPTSAGYDMIDAVRAARFVAPTAGTRWAAIGTSQGGQASWAAAEMAPQYGDGLEFLGSANLSPAADLSKVVADGKFDLTVPQQFLMPFVLEGFQARYPDVQDSDYLRGGLAANKDVLISCTGDLASQKFLAAGQIKEDDVSPTSPEALERIRQWLVDISLPKTAAAAPMMVLAGGRDNLVLPAWTEDATRRACALGDTIDFRLRPDQGHADGAAVGEGIDWIFDRFDGVTAANTCGSLP